MLAENSAAHDRRAVRRRRVDTVLFWFLCALVVLSAQAFVGVNNVRTFGGENGLIDSTGYVSYGLPVVYSEVSRYHRNEQLSSESTWHYFGGIVLLAVVGGAAYVLVRLARRIRPDGPISRPLVPLLIITLGFSLFLSALFSRLMWGYWFSPPPIDQRVLTARNVVGFGGLSSFGREHIVAPVRYPDKWGDREPDATESMVDYDLYHLKKAGLSMEPKGILGVGVETLRQTTLRPGVRVRNSAHAYNSQAILRGYWMELEAKEGGRLLFVSADGDQISNDHYPHYRLLYRLGGREPQLLSHNVTFFDVAGMEGLTWVWAFVTLSVLSAWGSLALAFIWMSVCDRRRRQAEVSASSG